VLAGDQGAGIKANGIVTSSADRGGIADRNLEKIALGGLDGNLGSHLGVTALAHCAVVQKNCNRV
jgi:hypothetical protein